MNADALFWFSAGNLLATLFATIGARSLRDFSRHELEELCEKHDSDLKLSDILKHDDEVAVSIECLHVTTSALFVTSAALWAALPTIAAPSFTAAFVAWTALGVSLLLLTCKVWIPWAVTRLWATSILFYTWRFWRSLSRLLAPVVLVARLVDGFLHRLAGRERVEPTEEIFEDEIRSIVSEGHREGLLEEDAREMIEGVIKLDDVDVAKAMTPRTDMIMISVELPWEEIIELMVQSPHTRIPVFRNTRDDVIGVLHAKDLLTMLAKNGDPPPLEEILREPIFVPETKRLDDLLEEFRETRNHLALVLDEYGGVSGLVTLEDILEEIVGEIVDEYDADVEEEIHAIDDRTVAVLARVHLDELNDRLGLELPDSGDFDTIGGFVFSQLGRVPEAGEEVTAGEIRIKVVEATSRRIERLKLVLPKSVALKRNRTQAV